MKPAITLAAFVLVFSAHSMFPGHPVHPIQSPVIPERPGHHLDHPIKRIDPILPVQEPCALARIACLAY